MQIRIEPRKYCAKTYDYVKELGFSDLVCRIVAGRITAEKEESHPEKGKPAQNETFLCANNGNGVLDGVLFPKLKHIYPPNILKDADIAVRRIGKSIQDRERIGILTDYDADGICAHMVLHEALTRHFGVSQDDLVHIIGHRLQDGYGISEGLTARLLHRNDLPTLIITADCGSSDEPRIAKLKEKGVDIIVTDHHALPTDGIPGSAYAVINPNRKDCPYPDKGIAGCMVAWLLMSHLRNYLVEEKILKKDAPKLSGLLDCVALGTVADSVPLNSPVNRAVVRSGLLLMNQLCRPAWRAFNRRLDRNRKPFTVHDLGFQLAPRINARSRMGDPYAAFHFLCSDTDKKAEICLDALERNNRERKETQEEMIIRARMMAIEANFRDCCAIVIADPDFHAGVQGIVASKLAETFGKPVVVMTESQTQGRLSGSARSFAGIDILSAIREVNSLHPEVFSHYGGHRAAAGLEIYADQLDAFSIALEKAVRKQVGDGGLCPVIRTDGPLPDSWISLQTYRDIQQLSPFGHMFEEPLFEGVFQVESVRRVGNPAIHISMRLAGSGRVFTAIWFKALETPEEDLPFAAGDDIHCVYRLTINDFRDLSRLQLVIDHAAPKTHGTG